MLSKITFAQFFCILITGMCLISILVIFAVIANNPSVLNSAVVASFLTAIVAAIITAMVKCYTFIVGSTASSQAKDASNKDTLDNAITNLANSTPVTGNYSKGTEIPAATKNS